MTGKRPTDPVFKEGVNIINFVQSNLPHQVFAAIDHHLLEECGDLSEASMVSENAIYQCLVSLLRVALSCSCPLPNERLNMKQVATKIHEIKTSYLAWKTKK